MKKPARTPSALWEFLSRRRAARRFTQYIGSPTAASHLFHLSRFVCHYWRIKINDLVFHPLRHGGLRYFFSFLSNSDSLRWRLFNDQNTAKMKGLLWLNVITDPFQTISEHKDFLEEWGWIVSRHFVRKIFVSWNWTWKRASYVQIQKYTSGILLTHLFKLSYEQGISLSTRIIYSGLRAKIFVDSSSSMRFMWWPVMSRAD